MTDDLEAETPRPMLRIINGGAPTDEELAALVAVISTRAGGEPAEAASLRPALSEWVKSGLVKGTRTKV